MRCDDIKELILTDYIDGQLSQERLLLVEDHLGKCAACLQLAQVLKASSITPFNEALQAMPSPRVWQNIKHSIENQQVVDAIKESRPNFWQNLSQGLRPLSYALGAAVVLVLATASYQHSKAPSSVYATMVWEDTSDDVASEVEQYFL